MERTLKKSTLLQSFVLSYLISLATAQQAFIFEPSDVSVVIGQTITLLCSVSDKAGSIAWTKGGNQPISIERNIIDPNNRDRYTVIGDDSSQDFNLQITSAELTDAGDFQCQVTASGSDGEIVSTVATVEVIDVPIQVFTIEPSNTNVPIDTTATLQCAVQDKAGFLQWEKDGVIITNDTTILDTSLTTYSITGDTNQGTYNLQILLAQESDEAVYRCIVTAAGFSQQITSATAVLSISTSGQRLEIVPFNTVAREGTDTRMLCRVADKSGVQTWLKDGQQLNEDENIIVSDSRYSIGGDQGNGEYHLDITGVEPEDAGSYFCTVSGVDGDPPISSGGATLTVTAAIAPDSGYPQCTQAPSSGLQEGDNVTLTCISYGGEPQPSLTWMTDAQEIYEDEYQDLGDHARHDLTLTLTPDLRYVVFSCQSSHPAYDSPQSCSLSALDFELQPTIELNLDRREIFVDEDDSTTVQCSATGDPPILSYTWYYNGIEIESDDSRFVMEVTAAKDAAYLQIVSAAKGMDEGVISCEASNRIDSESTYGIIMIQESNLYTIVLVAMILIAVVVFVVIFVIFVAPCLYSKHMKKSRVANDESLIATISDKLQNNFFITSNGHVPTGDGKKKKRKHKHKRHSKHKVIDYEAKKAAKKLKEIEKEVIYEDPNSIRSSTPKSKYSKSELFPEPRYVDFPFSTPRKSVDIEAGKRSTRASLENGDILRPLSKTPELKTIDETSRRKSKDRKSESRRSSKTTSSSRRHSSKGHRSSKSSQKVSLSPGEYAAREEYDRKLRELSDIREGLVDNKSTKRGSKISAST